MNSVADFSEAGDGFVEILENFCFSKVGGQVETSPKSVKSPGKPKTNMSSFGQVA